MADAFAYLSLCNMKVNTKTSLFVLSIVYVRTDRGSAFW